MKIAKLVDLHKNYVEFHYMSSKWQKARGISNENVYVNSNEVRQVMGLSGRKYWILSSTPINYVSMTLLTARDIWQGLVKQGWYRA